MISSRPPLHVAAAINARRPITTDGLHAWLNRIIQGNSTTAEMSYFIRT
jgi:hypothetical protein